MRRPGANVAALQEVATSTRTEADRLVAPVRAAQTSLASAEAQLDSLRATLDAALATVQDEVLGQLDAARQPLVQTVDAARQVLDATQEQVRARE
jgi:hypothetical protein